MARELAARRSTTATGAVRQALRAKPEGTGRESELQDAHYNEHGLPLAIQMWRLMLRRC